MRACVVALACWVGVAAFGAAIGTKMVEVEGEKVKLDGKEFPTKEPIEVKYALQTATRGPDRVLVAVGAVHSNLPHEWFKVTLTLTVYYGYKDTAWPLGFIGPAGTAEVTIDKPKPGSTTRFTAFFRNPEKKVLRPDQVVYSRATWEFTMLSKDDK